MNTLYIYRTLIGLFACGTRNTSRFMLTLAIDQSTIFFDSFFSLFVFFLNDTSKQT